MNGVPLHRGAAASAGTESPALRVLHLGFEDPLMPGAGGGSVRTREINRRLAADGVQVTVLTTRYPGCVDGVREGVRYEHVGIGRGGNRWTRLLGYVAALPAAVGARRDVDLVVEDFLPPFSSMAVPLWTRRPVVGMVQWLHAREKSRQYRLPLHLVERAAVRTHRRLITVSQGTAERLRQMNPGVHIDVIGNGVDPALFDEPPGLGRDVLSIGRLELEGKGIDLLLRAWAQVCDRIGGDLVVAGTGPDDGRARELARRLAIADRVRFVGWVSGADKARLLGGSRLVVVPSRAETFGMVAVEALAAGTPVVAFDIPCLREVVPPDCGRLVPAFEVGALGTAILDLYGDEAFLRSAGARGRAFASCYDWDRLAADQARAYRAAASQQVDRHLHPVHRSAGRR
jgi:glycosyltransferase involved in cell wall biosynthesis